MAGAALVRSGGKDGAGWNPDPTADVQAPVIPDNVSVATAQNWLAGALQLRAQELSSLQGDVNNATGLPAAVRASLDADLTTAAAGMARLTTSVEKDTTLAALRSDAATMVLTYHVFSVVEPQVHLTVVAEHQLAVASQIGRLQPGLETAIKAEGSRTSGTLHGLDVTLSSDLATVQSNANGVVSDLSTVGPTDYLDAAGVVVADTKVVTGDWSTVADARATIGKILSLLAG